jgi:hypothetical protein
MTGRAGQNGRPAGRGVTATAVLVAGAMLAGLGLSACGNDVRQASTVVRAARAATLELAGGASRPATVGMTVPRGATVRTAPGGSAALAAAGRTVLLGSATAVTVLDGAREQLRQGVVLVDARRSPGLALDAGAATVRTPRGGLARVERGALLRAAAYRRTLDVRATGRRASAAVPGLYQVQVPAGGLPGRVTPLALTPHDSWERSYVLGLVTADADLTALADGLDRNPASGSAVLRAVPATYAAGVTSVPGEPRSETALAFVLARATRVPTPGQYARVRGLRQDGGSWGVVAALVRADVARVSAALDAVLNPTEGPAALAAAANGQPLTAGGLLGGPGVPTAGRTGAPSRPRTGGGSSGQPRLTPTPTPSQDPVKDVVTTVTGLVPSATPSPMAKPPAPTISPTPLATLRVGPVSATLG